MLRIALDTNVYGRTVGSIPARPLGLKPRNKGHPPLAGDRKVETAEELLEVLRASERGLPAIKMWISEAVESVGRRIWEEQQEALRRTAS